MLETTIRFFTLLMRNNNLHVYRFSADSIPELDLGLRKALNIELINLREHLQSIEERIIYMFQTRFLWRYLALRLPHCDQFLLVGPYLIESIDDQTIMSIMEDMHLPPARFALVRRFFHSIPIVPSENLLFTSIGTLGDMLWGPDGYRTERIIQDAMYTLMEDRTCFIIAHRLSTIQNADLILVVRDGDIVEQGNHAQLMQKGGFYATLYNAQFAS